VHVILSYTCTLAKSRFYLGPLDNLSKKMPHCKRKAGTTTHWSFASGFLSIFKIF